ncbi:MAG: hypothetical protein R3F39_07005 [Myxococcota bacterium]
MVGRRVGSSAIAALIVLGLGVAITVGPAWADDARKPARKASERKSKSDKADEKKAEPEKGKEAGWPRRVVDPAPGTVHYVVQQALIVAQDPDARGAFQRYLKLMHEDWKHNDKAIRQLEAFSWQRFRRQVKDYVLEGTEGGFMMTRQDPEHLTDADVDARVFLQPINNKIRELPTPIRLRRVEGVWLITANSL